jgi:curved DNA-binding protein CbpA
MLPASPDVFDRLFILCPILFTADKNPSPDANDEFRRVAAAFEILGNQVNKKRYDAQYNQEMKRRRRFHEQERQWKEMRRRQNDADRRERQRRQTEMTHRARATQAKMVKIASMEDFTTSMLDSSTHAYKIHCLMMFVSNKNAEKLGEEIFHFPYPFAGEVEEYYSHSNVLRVAKASLHISFSVLVRRFL